MIKNQPFLLLLTHNSWLNKSYIMNRFISVGSFLPALLAAHPLFLFSSYTISYLNFVEVVLFFCIIMPYSSNTVRYILMVATAIIFLCSMATFLWDSTISVHIYKYTQVIKIDHNGEKFLSYLPHSGLSNQRTELENALLLASYLNRTLILPPAFLGHIRGWQAKDHLFYYMNSLTKPQPWWNRCNDKLGLADGPCHSKGDYATVPWEFLHSDINNLEIPMRSIRHVSLDNIKSMLTLSDDEVYVQHDTTMYSWQLCDKPKDRCPPLNSGGGHVYEQQWTIEDMKEIDKPLIQLQGVFGTGRVSVSQRNHGKLRTKIREALIYRNPAMEQVTEMIANQLGGKHNYFSIHVRMGDRQFKGSLRKHVEEQIEFLQKAQSEFTNSTTNSTCETNDFKIYVATDAKNPRASPELAAIFERFPCANVLGDYIDLLSPLEYEANLFQPPQKSIVKFLIPIIDAMVAANAKGFMGTPGSTFSAYINRLHSAYHKTNYQS
ncbi:hypothetical protein BGW37DRAFT_506996 [Umbelopsis sp. PMI_123]|nr:hypothetical protein BGW37DRAFT_506996 [Umbelopsis sp. PMI_123]